MQQNNKFKEIVINVLVLVDFLSKYKNLSESHQKDNNFKFNKREELILFLKKNGFEEARYVNKDSFYLVEDKMYNFNNDRIRIGMRFYFRYSEIDFVLTVEDNEGNYFGGPFGGVCEELGYAGWIYRPLFSSETELFEIVRKGIKIYNSFKDCLIQEFTILSGTKPHPL